MNAEVFVLQMLTEPIGIAVAVYYINKTGTEEDVKERFDEVLLYTQCCNHCLEEAVTNNTVPTCKYWCENCFTNRRVFDLHKDLFTDWRPDFRSCHACAIFNQVFIALEAKKDDIASDLESLVDTVTWILLICLSKNSTSHP